MSNTDIKSRRAKATRNKGILISTAAIFSLILLSVYKIPLFQNELDGKIMGFTEIHSKNELKLMATARLNNGTQVVASMPLGLQKNYDAKAILIEDVTIFGRKTYKVLSYYE